MNRLRTVTSFWKGVKHGRELNEHSQVDVDYVLVAGKVQYDWLDVLTIEEIPTELLNFTGYDITNIKHCTMVSLHDGKWFYAIEKFSVLEGEQVKYIKDKEEYDRKQKDVSMRIPVEVSNGRTEIG